MAMMPVRTKFRKMQKGQMAGFSKAANFLDFGELWHASSRKRLDYQQTN